MKSLLLLSVVLMGCASNPYIVNARPIDVRDEEPTMIEVCSSLHHGMISQQPIGVKCQTLSTEETIKLEKECDDVAARGYSCNKESCELYTGRWFCYSERLYVKEDSRQSWDELRVQLWYYPSNEELRKHYCNKGYTDYCQGKH